MGHGLIGIVEDIGSEVTTLTKVDLVVAPFGFSDSTCQFCRETCRPPALNPQAAFWDCTCRTANDDPFCLHRDWWMGWL